MEHGPAETMNALTRVLFFLVLLSVRSTLAVAPDRCSRRLGTCSCL